MWPYPPIVTNSSSRRGRFHRAGLHRGRARGYAARLDHVRGGGTRSSNHLITNSHEFTIHYQ